MDTVEEGVPANDTTVKAPPTLEEVNGNKTQARMGDDQKRLSAVSRMYDIDGDGQLDEAEMAMRDMDQSGKGYLTNDKVYKIMQEHLKDQREIFKFKKIVMGLAGFVVLLTLSNLGTSIAAAYLAKDTTTNDKDELTSSATGKALGTQTAVENFVVDKTDVESDASERDLQNCSKSGSTSVCSVNSFISVDNAQGKEIICLCNAGKNVDISRVWGDGSTRTFSLCPLGSNVRDLSGDCACKNSGAVDGDGGVCSYLSIDNDAVRIQRDGFSGKYMIDGDAFLSDEGGPCESADDCDSGLSCDACIAPPCTCQAPSTGGDELPVGGAVAAGCTSDADCGDLVCRDWNNDKNMYCGCDDNNGCTSAYAPVCIGGTSCACNVTAGDAACATSGYTCGLHCGIATSAPSCDLQSDRDGWCAGQDASTPICNAVTQSCQADEK